MSKLLSSESKIDYGRHTGDNSVVTAWITTPAVAGAPAELGGICDCGTCINCTYCRCPGCNPAYKRSAGEACSHLQPMSCDRTYAKEEARATCYLHSGWHLNGLHLLKLLELDRLLHHDSAPLTCLHDRHLHYHATLRDLQRLVLTIRGLHLQSLHTHWCLNHCSTPRCDRVRRTRRWRIIAGDDRLSSDSLCS